MEKIKQFIESERGKDILTVAIVILVGLGSFGLGRLSKEQNASSGLKIEYPAGEASVLSSVQTASSQTAQNYSSGNYFASSRGRKYYPAGCGAGDAIKQENRIYFATEAEAIKAGYEKSASCQ